MLNKVMLIGRMATAPELKYTPQGIAVASFRVACDRPKKQDGTKETDFIDVTCWRHTAEFVNQYVTVGRMVYVEGWLEVRQWTANDGTKRRAIQVQATQLNALDRPRERDGDGRQGGDERPRRETVAQEPVEDDPGWDVPEDPFADQ